MTTRHLYFCGTVFALSLAVSQSCFAQELAPNAAASNAVSAQTAAIVAKMVQESYHDLDGGNLNEALQVADSALQLDPHNSAIYELRGTIYIQKQLWDRAEADYNSALVIAPNAVVIKYKLAEIKFLQKDYDAARPRYAGIQNDDNLGDLSTYKLFLCDLLAGHQERATKELAVLNQTEFSNNPSHFYSNAAWALMHNKFKEANTWISVARQLFDNARSDPYVECLVNANDLHSPIVTFTTKEGRPFYQVKAFMEDDGLRVSTTKGWTTVPFDSLPDNLSAFPIEMRRNIIAKRKNLAKTEVDPNLLSFTTKQNKQYRDVRVSVEKEGLDVVTPDGLIVIPFNQLPDDLSAFPPGLQKIIADNRKTASEVESDGIFLSFTTKNGKFYDDVRSFLKEDGLQVITPDGLTVIPFGQLPDDLSSFPADLQKQITIKRKSVSSPGDSTSLPSFTTKQGKKYNQVRVAVDKEGLQVLTSDGWIVIPFKQLPDDLSPFSLELRKWIASNRQSTQEADVAELKISFTTKKGIIYDNERVAVADNGLQVLTPDGWTTVPFNQLPSDLSIFPAIFRKQLEEKRQAASDAEGNTKWASFTTKTGKHYDQVRVTTLPEGLQVLTSDGLVSIPYQQLPDDLSSFPAGLRKQIVEKQKAFTAESKMPVPAATSP